MKRWSQFCYKRASSGGWSSSTAWRTMTFQKVRNGCRTQSSEFQWSLTSPSSFRITPSLKISNHFILCYRHLGLFSRLDSLTSLVYSNMSKETGQGATMCYNGLDCCTQSQSNNEAAPEKLQILEVRQQTAADSKRRPGAWRRFELFRRTKAAKVYRSFDVNCSWEFV